MSFLQTWHLQKRYGLSHAAYGQAWGRRKLQGRKLAKRQAAFSKRKGQLKEMKEYHDRTKLLRAEEEGRLIEMVNGDCPTLPLVCCCAARCCVSVVCQRVLTRARAHTAVCSRVPHAFFPRIRYT